MDAMDDPATLEWRCSALLRLWDAEDEEDAEQSAAVIGERDDEQAVALAPSGVVLPVLPVLGADAPTGIAPAPRAPSCAAAPLPNRESCAHSWNCGRLIMQFHATIRRDADGRNQVFDPATSSVAHLQPSHKSDRAGSAVHLSHRVEHGRIE